MDVPWLSGLQMKSVSSFAALMCDFFFPQVKAVENLDTLFFWHLLQMPKYWQCLLFLFFPIWIPVITVKKVSCQFSIMNLFSSGLLFKISVLHCCTCCLSFFENWQEWECLCFSASKVNLFYWLRQIWSAPFLHFLIRQSVCSLKGLLGYLSQQQPWGTDKWFFLHKCAIFDTARSEQNEFYSNWCNTYCHPWCTHGCRKMSTNFPLPVGCLNVCLCQSL